MKKNVRVFVHTYDDCQTFSAFPAKCTNYGATFLVETTAEFDMPTEGEILANKIEALEREKAEAAKNFAETTARINRKLAELQAIEVSR